MSNEMKKKMIRWRVFNFRVITEAKMEREKNNNCFRGYIYKQNQSRVVIFKCRSRRASKTCSYGDKSGLRESMKMAEQEKTFREQSFEGFKLIGPSRTI